MSDIKYKYTPLNLKDLLIEMKDTSELMIDLAYSAMIYNNEEIAEEVIHLEEKMEVLDYHIKMVTMLSARRIEEAEQLLGVLEVASASENIANAALEVSKCVLMNISVPEQLKIALKKAEETIIKVSVSEKSSMIGEALGDLELDINTGMWIIAIRRDSDWIYDPGKNTKIRKNDVLIARGHDDGVPIFYEKATNGKYIPKDQINTTNSLNLGYSIDLIVEMKNMCELSVGLGYSALLFNNKDIAEEVQSISSHLDKMKYNVQHLVLKASKLTNCFSELQGMLILSTASETISNAASNIVDPILRDINLHPIIAMAVRESDEIIMKIQISPRSKIVNKTLKDLKLETETGIYILAIKRENKWLYSVNGKIVLKEYDILIARGSKVGEEVLIEYCSYP